MNGGGGGRGRQDTNQSITDFLTGLNTCGTADLHTLESSHLFQAQGSGTPWGCPLFAEMMGHKRSWRSSNSYLLPISLTTLTQNRFPGHPEDPIETHLQFKTNRVRNHCGALWAERSSLPKWNLSNPILVAQIFLMFLTISFKSLFFIVFLKMSILWMSNYSWWSWVFPHFSPPETNKVFLFV